LDDKDIASEIKQYSTLAMKVGKILWTAPNKIRFKCFIFRVQDINPMGLNPLFIPFLASITIADIQSHMDQLDNFVAKSDQCVTAMKVTPLKHEIKWNGWKSRFIDLLKGIPGIKKVPLIYVLCANPTPTPSHLMVNMTYIN
jgi:hypothetical protein